MMVFSDSENKSLHPVLSVGKIEVNQTDLLVTS